MYCKIPKLRLSLLLKLGAFGGCYFRGAKKTLYKVSVSELFFQNKRRKFLKTVFKK